MVETSFGYLLRRRSACEIGVYETLNGRDLVGQTACSFDIRLEPSFDRVNLVSKVYCCRAEGWTV
jgi:hypothetical protein